MRSKLGRLTTAATVAVLLGSGAAQAASVVAQVSGTWDGLHAWNPGQNGGKIVETTVGGGPEMVVQGTMTYDDITGNVTALSITGSLWRGVWAAGFNQVQMQNYAWSSVGTDLKLLAGTNRLACDRLGNGVFVTGASAACGPGYQNGQGTLNLLLDFTGVNTTITAGSGGGTTFLPVQPGFSGTVVNGQTSIYAIKAYNPFIPLAADSTFNLHIVPVPGAVWLFGSALGLMGVARRRLVAA